MIILNFVYSRLSPKVHHHLKYFHSSILFSIFAQIFWKMIHENNAKKIFHKETVKKNHRCPKTANTLNTSFYSFLRLSIPVRLSPLAFSIRKIYQGAPWPKKYRWFVSITRIFSTSSLLPQHAPMLRMEQQCIHWCILFSSFSFTGHSVGPRLTLVFVFAERLQGNNDPF